MAATMKYLVNVCLILLSSFSIVASCMSNESNRDELDSVLELHFKAIKNRDITSLLKTVSETEIILILPNGKYSKSLSEYRATNEEWFSESDWKIDYEVLEKNIFGNIGIILTKITYSDKNELGEDYSFQYFLTLVFKYDNNWKLFYDQNTLIK